MAAFRSSPHRLPQAEQVTLAIPEPGSRLADPFAWVVPFDLGNAIHSLETRRVVVFKYHSTGSQRRDSGLEVGDLPRHLGVTAGRGARRLEQRKISASTSVQKASRPDLYRLQPQFLQVESSGAIEMLRWKARRNR